ncbi:hypothetical protein BS47DRAFT_1369938 [Hydnum rufescens UP504]|uniref:Uncharacterized protein n=1 Tax=Hydnum rufescens UP504 TaxID=1448309 RepID=A0A9P6ABU6_9AGAM|nr:hypothetical protein BS47DRAFT_1369938 [Hydnum rufescens UP504]
MAPPQWAEGSSKNDWLNEHGPSYQQALYSKTKVAFLEQVFHDWFEKYHWSLGHKEEANPNATYLSLSTRRGFLKEQNDCGQKRARHDDTRHIEKLKVLAPSPFPSIGPQPSSPL